MLYPLTCLGRGRTGARRGCRPADRGRRGPRRGARSRRRRHGPRARGPRGGRGRGGRSSARRRAVATATIRRICTRVSLRRTADPPAPPERSRAPASSSRPRRTCRGCREGVAGAPAGNVGTHTVPLGMPSCKHPGSRRITRDALVETVAHTSRHGPGGSGRRRPGWVRREPSAARTVAGSPRGGRCQLGPGGTRPLASGAFVAKRHPAVARQASRPWGRPGPARDGPRRRVRHPLARARGRPRAECSHELERCMPAHRAG